MIYKTIRFYFYVERDLARQLIVRALDGLGEGDRFRTVLPSLDVDMDTLNNFVQGSVDFFFVSFRKIVELYLESKFLNYLLMEYIDQLLNDRKEEINFDH